MATSATLKKPTSPVKQELQAINWVRLGQEIIKFGKAVWDWAKDPKNWPTIGLGIKEVIDFVVGLFQPKTSAEYQSMTDAGKKSVDGLTQNLTQAFANGDSAGVVSNLKAIAKVYETQAKIASDPAKAEALQKKAQRIEAIADGVAKGEIPLDPGIANRVKEEDGKGKQGSENPLTNNQESLNQNLQKLVEKALTNLDFRQVDSTNSRQVASELLAIGASPEVAKQALSYNYETKGLTKLQSMALATIDVEGAGNNELDGTNPNKQNDPAPAVEVEPGGG